MQSERELREEIEQLGEAIKRAEQELAQWDTTARVVDKRAALVAEIEELTHRAADAKVELEAAPAQLRQLNGELSQARDSARDARWSIAQLEPSAPKPLGCLVLLTLVPAIGWLLR